jgi:GTP-binding protein
MTSDTQVKIVAIIGRTNVGKSTLFNCLTGRKKAIVHNRPGVTRDRREGDASLFDLKFRLIDTAGLEETGDLAEAMWKQTEIAIEQADILLYVVDAVLGITPQDDKLAAFLRKKNKPVYLLANKAESKEGKSGSAEGFVLGLGEPISISAEHRLGLDVLYQKLRQHIPASETAKLSRRQLKKLENKQEQNQENTDSEDSFTDSVVKKNDDKAIKIAIVGRPNVGKSTLVNRLLGQNRMLTGPQAGVTRDSISIPWTYDGRKIELVDTAGLRRSSKVDDSLEKLAAADTKRSAFTAQVVILVLDADAVLEKQDLTIASQVISEGRALIIAVNKWDAAKDKKESLQRLGDKLQTSLRQVRGIPALTISALTGAGIDELMKTVFAIYEKWNKRVPTSPLNRWLEKAVERHPTPLAKNGRRIPMKYITQIKARPPSFVIFSSNPSELPESYFRYLINGIRDNFDLDGVPLRLIVRKPKNPYATENKK